MVLDVGMLLQERSGRAPSLNPIAPFNMAGEMPIELSTSTICVSPSEPKLDSWLTRAEQGSLSLAAVRIAGESGRAHAQEVAWHGLAISDKLDHGLMFGDVLSSSICSLIVMDNRAWSLGQNKLLRNWIAKLVQFIGAI